jgi:GT2 family glycosyltransferase
MVTFIANIFKEKNTDGLDNLVKTSGITEYELLINDNSVNNIGNPQGLNKLVKQAKNEYIVILANDFTAELNWIKKALPLIEESDVALVGFHWCEELYRKTGNKVFEKGKPITINNTPAFIAKQIYGMWLLKKSVHEEIGGFREYSKYGQWDTEYIKRCRYFGYLCVYSNVISQHTGTDGNDPEYRAFKNEQLKIANEKYNEEVNYLKCLKK